MTRRSGAHALVESLLSEGVTTVFGIPGVGTLPVYDAFVDHPDLRHVEVRHEQAAVFMADGHARASGRIACAFTSGGPGALNTPTAMATAFNDSVPLLHVVNENPASVRRKGKGHFHDIADQFGVLRPVTGFAAQVLLADEIPAAVNQAVLALLDRRPRPALVEIAAEALSDGTDVPTPPPARRRPRPPEPAALAAAAELLASARRPLVWAGGGVATPEAADALRRLAELTKAPVVTTQKGKGALPARHPLHLGNWANELPVRRLVADCDLVVAVGTRFSYFPTGAWSLRLPDAVVQIDLDPAEIGRNYPVAVGIVADAALALDALADALAGSGYRPPRDGEEEVADALGRIRDAIGEPIEVEILDQIRNVLPDDALVFNDPTTLAFWARSWWGTDRPRTWFIPSGFGTLGYALPAAIGGKLARPEAPTVALMGDAGIMFTVQDLMTAVQEGVGVVVVVVNDGGYGVERRHQDHLYGRRSGVDVLPPDFVALARAFGAEGVRVDDLACVGAAVESALERGGPVLVEVPGEFRHPGYGSFARWEE